MLDYSQISPEVIASGVGEAIARAGEVLDVVVDPATDSTFETIMRPLDRISDILGKANASYAFMGYVHTDPAVKEAGNDAQALLQQFGVEMIFRDDLYAAVKSYSETEEAAGLDGEEARLLEFVLRDLRRAGHELEPEQRASLKEKTQRLVDLGIQFEANIDKDENKLLVDVEDLAGLPESYVESLETDDETGQLVVTMAYPHIIPFLDNAERRHLRERAAFLFNTRAVEPNRPILDEAIRLRNECAEIFGLDSWADYVLEERMAKDPATVSGFYEELIPPLTEAAGTELEAMTALLERDTGETVLRQWDWRYYDNLQRRTDFGVDQYEVAKYLPLNRVLEGMFQLVEETFGVVIEEIPGVASWDPEVTYHAIKDKESGEVLAHFYLDLFPRAGTFGHAAEFPLIYSREMEDGSYQSPICAMVANFTKPTKDAPSLLQHSELETLFHEFGHVLHQNLGRTRLARFSGTSVERDFVEAPSQIMQHWVWRADVLSRFARHYQTDEPIPTELVDQLVAARKLNVAITQLRQVQFGILDAEMHGPGSTKDLDAILRRATALSLMPFHEGTFFPASFGHLMGGYDASYYGYMWAEVFGDDMFSRFEAEGVTNPEVGMSYRREVLERGGTLDADVMLRNFLGREPDNGAFLRKLGITGTD